MTTSTTNTLEETDLFDWPADHALGMSMRRLEKTLRW